MSQMGSSSVATALSGGTPTESPNTATACFVTSVALTVVVSAGGVGGSGGTAMAGTESAGRAIGTSTRPGAGARTHAPSTRSTAVWATIRVTFNFDSFSLGRCRAPGERRRQGMEMPAAVAVGGPARRVRCPTPCRAPRSASTSGYEIPEDAIGCVEDRNDRAPDRVLFGEVAAEETPRAVAALHADRDDHDIRVEGSQRLDANELELDGVVGKALEGMQRGFRRDAKVAERARLAL